MKTKDTGNILTNTIKGRLSDSATLRGSVRSIHDGIIHDNANRLAYWLLLLKGLTSCPTLLKKALVPIRESLCITLQTSFTVLSLS